MHSFKSILVILAVLAVPSLHQAAAQVADVQAITWDLRSIRGSLELLDDQRASIISDDGERLMLSPDDIAFIEFLGTIKARRSSGEMGEVTNGLLRLVDGTRYTGWSEVEQGRFVWRNWWAGTVRPEIDQILYFIDRGRTAPPHVEDEDVLVLANGDVVAGIITELGSSVKLEKVDGSRIDVPMNRVRSVSFVNPEQTPKGASLWLVQGDEIPVDGFRYDTGTGLRVGDHETLMPRSITAIAFDASRILPLPGIAATVSALPGAERFHVPKPEVRTGAWPLDAPWVQLRGPLRVEWPLPKKGMGFTARVVLPPLARRLGDVELVILDGERVLHSVHLDGRSPVAEVAITLPDDKLVIELRESDGGPLQDIVRLERALLLDPAR